MLDKKDYFLFGSISKIRSYKGELSIKLESTNIPDISKIEFVFLDITKKLVPFFVENMTHPQNGFTIVKLEDVDTEAQANELLKLEVYLPLKLQSKKKDKQKQFNELIGFAVVDKTYGNIGIIEDVVDYPHQTILQIKFDKKEILIPFIDEIVNDINKKSKTIKLDCPEGLIAIYL